MLLLSHLLAENLLVHMALEISNQLLWVLYWSELSNHEYQESPNISYSHTFFVFLHP